MMGRGVIINCARERKDKSTQGVTIAKKNSKVLICVVENLRLYIRKEVC